MLPKSIKSKLIAIVFALLALLLIILGGFYYYVHIYKNREFYPLVKSTVNQTDLENLGFKKIDLGEGKYSFFAPTRWINIDRDLSVFGDVLTGSNAYLLKYPNSLGKLTNDICSNVIKESVDKITSGGTYSEISIVDNNVKKVGDYTGCIANVKTKVAKKDFSIIQFYIFRKDSVYLLQTQYPSESTIEKDTADQIIRSIALSE